MVIRNTSKNSKGTRHLGNEQNEVLHSNACSEINHKKRDINIKDCF